MKLKEIEIAALEVVGDVALSVISSEGGMYAILDANISNLDNTMLTERVADFTRKGDTLEWRGQVINLDQ
jgi:hypothetical protein